VWRTRSVSPALCACGATVPLIENNSLAGTVRLPAPPLKSFNHVAELFSVFANSRLCPSTVSGSLFMRREHTNDNASASLISKTSALLCRAAGVLARDALMFIHYQMRFLVWARHRRLP
jgi:hypothetical protein